MHDNDDDLTIYAQEGGGQLPYKQDQCSRSEFSEELQGVPSSCFMNMA